MTVMIPAYKQAQFVARAIRSAARQDYPNIEVVVSDDFSPDDTAKIAAETISAMPELNARVVRNAQNWGILRNYHKTLFEQARGDWVVNLDADDYFVDDHFISAAMLQVGADPELRLVFADYREVQERDGSTIAIRNPAHPSTMSDREFFERFAEGRVRWNHNAIVYSRADALRVGCYWQEGELRNDWESFLRLIIGGKVAYLPREVSAWVQHGANETRRLDLAKYLDNFTLLENLGRYAIGARMDRGFVEGWMEQMKRTLAADTCGAYAGSRDLHGMIDFLRLAPLPALTKLRLLASPGNLARLVLARGSAPYRLVKRLRHGRNRPGPAL